MIDKKLMRALENEKDKRVVMLQSGGLDSNVLAAIFSWLGYEVHYLFVYYGQNSGTTEKSNVYAISDYYGGEMHSAQVNFPWLFKNDNVKLVGGDVNDWESNGEALNTLQEGTYVPARNLMLLSMAQSLAESLGISNIACAFDGMETKFTHTPLAGTTDKHPRFVKMLSKTMTEASSLYWTVGKRTKIYTPLMSKLKPEIIRTGIQYGARFELSWSCYNRPDNNGLPCMKCSACRTRTEAFRKVGMQDPLITETLASKPGM